MSDVPPRIPEQVVRLGIVVSVVGGGILVLYAFAIPPQYKDTALQRAAAVEREKAKPTHYAGESACKECHEDQTKEKHDGKHRNLSCGTCHGALQKHIDDPLNEANKPYAPRERDFCPQCHAYDPARPTGFPQINPSIHNPLKACITCHKPHAPEPPDTPQECSACHAEIARTKMVSPHALLECTTCHTTPEEHKTNPRGAKPTKPTTREFCGTCHNKGAAEKTAPKIDTSSHNEKYLCWQCHYPHSP